MMNLAEYGAKQARLADYLPWACLVAPGVVLNKDGSFQRSARFRGPDLDSATEGELVAACARVNNALKRLGSGWALYFEAARVPARPYPASHWQDPVAWLIDEERRAAFEGSGALLESVYHVTFGYLPPADTTDGLVGLFVEKGDDENEGVADTLLHRFVTETDRILDLFSDVLPETAWLDDDETLTFLQSTVSPNRHPVRAPDTPAYLDAVLGGADLACGLAPTLGGAHLRTLTVQGFPSQTEPGLLDGLNALGFPYRWTTRFLPLDKAQATKTLSRYRRQWFAKRKSVLSVLREVMTEEASQLVDTDADNQAADADAALQALGGNHVGFGYLTSTVTLHDENAEVAAERIRAVERVINGCGFVTIREEVNAVDAWLGTLPGHPYANIRQPLVHTLNLAHMMPLSAIWAGPERNEHLGGPPLLLATTGSHTPFRLVTHQGDVGHTMVVGPTGAGKSVLLSLMAMQFRRYEGAQVFLFDKGRSAKATTLGMHGEHFELGGSPNEGGGLCFQPLADIDEAATKLWAQGWIAGLLASEGATIDAEAKAAIWTALNSLVGAPRGERTLTGLSALLQSNHLREALRPFTLEGAYGQVLDGDAEALGASDWQCFETEGLMDTPDLAGPVLTYLFHRLEMRFDGRPTLLILDEAWVFLDDPVFAGRIREWLKTLRKKNVSVVFATQSLDDVAESTIAPAIIESCPSRIFLPNPRATEPQQREAYAKFGLNDRQVEIVARAAPKRDYYFQSRAGNRLFDLALGPAALAFCGASSKDDLRAIDEILATTGRDRFAEAWLHHRGLDWAADLIAANPGVAEPATVEPAAVQGAFSCAAE